jgi:hypothetical protein
MQIKAARASRACVRLVPQRTSLEAYRARLGLGRLGP